MENISAAKQRWESAEIKDNDDMYFSMEPVDDVQTDDNQFRNWVFINYWTYRITFTKTQKVTGLCAQLDSIGISFSWWIYCPNQLLLIQWRSCAKNSLTPSQFIERYVIENSSHSKVILDTYREYWQIQKIHRRYERAAQRSKTCLDREIRRLDQRMETTSQNDPTRILCRIQG